MSTVLEQLMELTTSELSDAMCEFFHADNGWQADILGDLLFDDEELGIRFHDAMAQHLANDVSESDLVEHDIIDGTESFHKERALELCESFLKEHELVTNRITDNEGECYGIEFEGFTGLGVNMLHFLDGREYDMTDEDWWKSAIYALYEDFSVDEEIDLHRQDENFRSSFSIRQCLDDFEAWEERLEALYDAA